MILSNQVRCLKCADTPFSAHRHDYKSCSCGAVAVDGGMSYLRRVGDMAACEEMSIEIPDAVAGEAMVSIARDRSNKQLEMAREGVTRVLQKHGVILEVSLEAKEAANDLLDWCIDTGRNDLGVLCAIARAYRDKGVVFHQVENA